MSKMTREDRLYAMRMVELVEVAEAEGVKIDRKGSKAKAVEKILAAEAARAEVVAEEAEALTESFQTEGVYTVEGQTIEEIEAAAEVEEPKSEKKAVVKQDRFALVLGAVPTLRGNLVYRRLKGDRVGIVSGNRRLMAIGKGRHGYTVVTNKFDKLVGLDIKFRKTSDGRDAVFTDIPAADMEKVVRHLVTAG